jgi:hypothetical protein
MTREEGRIREHNRNAEEECQYFFPKNSKTTTETTKSKSIGEKKE